MGLGCIQVCLYVYRYICLLKYRDNGKENDKCIVGIIGSIVLSEFQVSRKKSTSGEDT